eukprot:COSAG04_NODE_18368_length_444_cov_0.637681_2_plen_35_part_01
MAETGPQHCCARAIALTQSKILAVHVKLGEVLAGG